MNSLVLILIVNRENIFNQRGIGVRNKAVKVEPDYPGIKLLVKFRKTYFKIIDGSTWRHTNKVNVAMPPKDIYLSELIS